MDVQQRLDEIVATVDGARAMPMSASCVVNRTELLAMLQEVRTALPGSLAQAEEVLGGREQVVAEAHHEARQILDDARAERGSLVSETEVVRQSRQEADRILAEARTEAEAIRTEADDYVDSKLANFEVVLSKTIGSVERGREKLLGGGPGADPYDEGFAADAPDRSQDPAELRRRADSYVDARLGAVAAVLTKTLEAVGRGRQKLVGYDPVDELASHLAVQDGAGRPAESSDAEYLAGLASTDVAQVPAQATPQPANLPGQTAAAMTTAYPPPPSEPPAASGHPMPGGYPAPQQPPAEPPVGQPVGQPGGHFGQPYDAYQPGGQEAYQPVGQETYGGQHYPDPAYQQPYQETFNSPAQPYGAYGWAGERYHQGQPYGLPDQSQPPQQPQPGNQPGELEETSLFDTSMIDMNQVRQYEARYDSGY
ncbi:hypothetical protein [Streptomyces oceani]|uniref:Cell division initiation protein n=1 Tax=Streptomyces oceani TaxID=1075402 RepID=A0A1E7JRL0_9ACTN|nr:hypothetical protein [Streptomyces oceani]OEU91424.1 hypothetical protein AN216_25175 [Streptomyces oceani]